MLRRFMADLHIHTVLSPCADYHMVPQLILERAAEKGLNLVAVTDHNSGENAVAMVSAAENSGVAVLPGMEVESREGVHVVALFDSVEALERWQQVVYEALPQRKNVEKAFGTQVVVNAEGDPIRINDRLLMAAVNLSLDEVVDRVSEMGGITIPAHVDRPANGLLGVLGMLPQDLETAAVEISPRFTLESARETFPELRGRTLVRSSDAHWLEDVGKVATPFLIAEATVAEIELACRREQGRTVLDN